MKIFIISAKWTSWMAETLFCSICVWLCICAQQTCTTELHLPWNG